MIDFDPSLLGPYFTFRDFIVSIGLNTPTVILAANLQRVAVYFSVGSGTVILRPMLSSSGTLGFNVTNTLNPFPLKFADWGPLVGQQWSAFSSAGATIYGLEVIYRPPSE